MDLTWWVSAIGIPGPGGLFWLLQSHRASNERDLKAPRDELAAFKLHVATSYASIVYLNTVLEIGDTLSIVAPSHPLPTSSSPSATLLVKSNSRTVTAGFASQQSALTC